MHIPRSETWDRCNESRCRGVSRVDGRCYAHLDAAQLARALQLVNATGLIDARGVDLTEQLLTELVDAIPVEEGRPRLHRGRFDGARFTCDAAFRGMEFVVMASFRQARFEGIADFDDVLFGSTVEFDHAVFRRRATFRAARFMQAASFKAAQFAELTSFGGSRFVAESDFKNVKFKSRARFGATTFERRASFDGASFEGSGWFNSALFMGSAVFHGSSFAERATFTRAQFLYASRFEGAKFNGEASFRRASLAGFAGFSRAEFRQRAEFDAASFEGGASFDGCKFSEGALIRRASFSDVSFEETELQGSMLALNRSLFSAPVKLTTRAQELSCKGTYFREGVHLRAEAVSVDLEEAVFGTPSLVEGVRPGGGNQPRLLSVRRADVKDVVLAELDLRPTLFRSAHNLDRLRIEASCQLGRAPSWALSTTWPFFWRWTKRDVLAEEHRWRANQRRPRGWYPENCKSPAGEALASTREIAATYRGLRKGKEDSKDAPGAADFYFGEMEMRRHSTDTGRSRGERVILYLYWLFSGYGLRSSRAFTAFLLVVLLSAIVFKQCGIRGAPGYVESVLFAARTSTALPHADDATPLTAVGEAFQIVVRILGPLFLALALISIRGRVRR